MVPGNVPVGDSSPYRTRTSELRAVSVKSYVQMYVPIDVSIAKSRKCRHEVSVYLTSSSYMELLTVWRTDSYHDQWLLATLAASGILHVADHRHMFREAMLIQVSISICCDDDDRAGSVDKIFMDWSNTVGCIRGVQYSSVSLSRQ